ncbi:MAG: DUF4430 domain-containing protein [candidate division Zixibacteria bacterium]|nr:DUF4430 domain-containing protein [candidate division Zixibacteria bacterium]
MNTIRFWPMLLTSCCLLISCGGGAEQERTGDQPVAADRPPGVLIVNYAPDSSDTFPAPKVDSVLALEWLQMYTNARGLNMATRQFSFGDLVIQIGPRRAGDGGDWLYEVNGEMATAAVSEQRVARTDTLSFTFK